MEQLSNQVIDGTLGFASFNRLALEIETCITQLQSLTASKTNQLVQSVIILGSLNFSIASGTANAIVLSPIIGIEGPFSLIHGYTHRFRPTATNTGAVTVNLASLGANALTLEDGTALSGGELSTNKDAWIRWNNTNTRWQLINTGTSGSSSVFSVPNNLVVNSDFKIWQHGEQFDSVTPLGSPGNNDASYTADQWILLSDGNDIIDVTRVTDDADLANDAESAISLDVQVANTKFGLLQIIESKKVIPIRGSNLSFRFEIRNDLAGDLTDMRAYLIEWTGTADAPTKDPISTWNGATVLPTLATNWAYMSSSEIQITGLDGNWTIFSDPTATIGASANNIGILFISHDSSFNTSNRIHITNVSVKRSGDVGYSPNPEEVDLLQCQRFYWKTFPLAVVAGQSQGFAGAIYSRTFDYANVVGELSEWVAFPAEMVFAPTVTTFNPTQANANWRRSDDGADKGAGTTGISVKGVQIGGSAAASTNATYALQLEADSRF